LVLPDEPPPREKVGEGTKRLDPPARVRYPVKRITTAEVRKRVRGILDYVGRVQLEEARRKERAELIGIDNVTLPDVAQPELLPGDNEEELPPREVERVKAGDGAKSTMDLLEELAQDLILYQETLASGGFGVGVGVGTPVPPGISVFVGVEIETPLTTPFLAEMVVEASNELEPELEAEAEVEEIREGVIARQEEDVVAQGDVDGLVVPEGGDDRMQGEEETAMARETLDDVIADELAAALAPEDGVEKMKDALNGATDQEEGVADMRDDEDGFVPHEEGGHLGDEDEVMGDGDADDLGGKDVIPLKEPIPVEQEQDVPALSSSEVDVSHHHRNRSITPELATIPTDLPQEANGEDEIEDKDDDADEAVREFEKSESGDTESEENLRSGPNVNHREHRDNPPGVGW
jgi:hypothetical protein